MSKKTRKAYAWEAIEGEEAVPDSGAVPSPDPVPMPEIPPEEAAEPAPDWRKRRKAEDRKLDEKFVLVKGTWLERKWLPSRPLTVTVRQLKRWGYDHRRLISTGVIVPEKKAEEQ